MIGGLWLLLAPLAVSVVGSQSSKPTVSTSNVVEGSYIIEVDPTASSFAKRDLTHKAVSPPALACPSVGRG